MKTAVMPVVNYRRLLKRGLALVAAAIGLYVVWPSLVEIFSSWPALVSLEPWWLVGMVVCEAVSFALLWLVLEIALHTDRTALVATTQLASNAFGRVMPGGGATASALQYRLLVRGGLEPGRVAAGLTATQLLTLAVLAAMPLLSLPAIIVGGSAVDRGLVQSAIVGVAAFALVLIATTVFLASDRALSWAARVGQSARNRLLRKREPMQGLPARLVEQRDAMVRTIGRHWWLALTAAAGRTLLDYLALLCALSAVGTTPRPGLVLLAYVAATLLGMIPITPGGLGFVEAGLSGMLTLAGVGAADAVLATLAYRLASYWLPILAGAAAYGAYHFGFKEQPAE